MTFNGHAEGLSHDGRLLVLSAEGRRQLRCAPRAASSRSTRAPCAVKRTIRLPGDFAYDTVSPNGRFLYLIEHFSNTDVLRYRVRAYDLKQGRLLPRVIVDKRDPAS